MVNKREIIKQPMVPSQNKITAADLVSRNKSAAVKAIYDRALKHAYEDQQALLKKAEALKNSKRT